MKVEENSSTDTNRIAKGLNNSKVDLIFGTRRVCSEKYDIVYAEGAVCSDVMYVDRVYLLIVRVPSFGTQDGDTG